MARSLFNFRRPSQTGKVNGHEVLAEVVMKTLSRLQQGGRVKLVRDRQGQILLQAARPRR